MEGGRGKETQKAEGIVQPSTAPVERHTTRASQAVLSFFPFSSHRSGNWGKKMTVKRLGWSWRLQGNVTRHYVQTSVNWSFGFFLSTAPPLQSLDIEKRKSCVQNICHWQTMFFHRQHVQACRENRIDNFSSLREVGYVYSFLLRMKSCSFWRGYI